MTTKLKPWNALKPATKRAYSEAFKRFCAHCAARGCAAVPIDPELVADWLDVQALAGAPIATLDVARCALDHVALRAGAGAAPPSRSPAVREAMARARNVARLPEHRDRRRTHRVVVQVSEAELAELRAEAAAGQYSVPGYVRAKLLGPCWARRLVPRAAKTKRGVVGVHEETRVHEKRCDQTGRRDSRSTGVRQT